MTIWILINYQVCLQKSNDIFMNTFLLICNENHSKHWGHANEYSNPDEIIAEIFKDDNVYDVIHNYSYEKVSNVFNIAMS